MTKDDLYFYTEVKKTLEFQYNNKTYLLSYGTDADGHPCLEFGELYAQEKFSCYQDLYVRAKVENSYFREMLDIINPQ